MSYRRIIALVVLTAFTDSLAEEFLHPLIVVRLEDQGIRAALIGLAIGAGDLGVLLTAPFVPRLIRRVSPLVYVRTCLCLICGGILLFPLFPNVYVWIVLDFALGVLTCGYFVLSDSLINAASGEQRRGRLIALYMMSESTGAILGPLLLSRVGFAGFSPFVVAMLIMAVGIAPWFTLRPLHAPDLSAEATVSFLPLLRAAPLILVVAVAAAFFADVPTSLLPVFALEHGLDEKTAVLLLSAIAVGTVLFQIPAGWLADSMDRRTLLLLLALVTAGATSMMAPIISDPVIVWPWMLLLGGLFNAFDVVALTLLGERAGPGQLAHLSAATTMAASIAGFAGPPATGLAMDLAGPNAFPVALAAMAGVVAFAVLVDRRRGARKSLRPGSS
jgi:MFS family permease